MQREGVLRNCTWIMSQVLGSIQCAFWGYTLVLGFALAYRNSKCWKIECKTNKCVLCFLRYQTTTKIWNFGCLKKEIFHKKLRRYIESSAGRRGTKWCLVIELPRRENYPSLLRLLNFLHTKNNNESWTFVYGMCYKPLSQTY